MLDKTYVLPSYNPELKKRIKSFFEAYDSHYQGWKENMKDLQSRGDVVKEIKRRAVESSRKTPVHIFHTGFTHMFTTCLSVLSTPHHLDKTCHMPEPAEYSQSSLQVLNEEFLGSGYHSAKLH